MKSRVQLVDRPDWDEVWMSFAKKIAERSYDPRYRVGSVIVDSKNTRVLSLGYNGNYSGGPNEAESMEPGQSGMVHSELNALLKLDYHHPCEKIMYVTLSPCRACAKACINSNIKEVVYSELYRDTSGIELLESAGIKCRHVP